MMQRRRSGSTPSAMVGTQEKVTIIPAVFYKLCALLIEGGLETEGIFRVSGDQVKIKNTCKNFAECPSTDSLSRQDIHNIAGVLKYYIRNNTEPLVPQMLYNNFLSAQEAKSVELLKQAVSELPAANKLLLHCLVDLLYKVAEHSEKNKMDATNLGVVFGPTIMWNTAEEDLALSLQNNKLQCELVVTFINRHNEIFPEPLVPDQYLTLSDPPIVDRPVESDSRLFKSHPMPSAAPIKTGFQLFFGGSRGSERKESTAENDTAVLRQHKMRQNMFAMLVKKEEQERLQLLSMIDTLQKKVTELENQTRSNSISTGISLDHFRDITETVDAVKLRLSTPLARTMVDAHTNQPNQILSVPGVELSTHDVIPDTLDGSHDEQDRETPTEASSASQNQAAALTTSTSQILEPPHQPHPQRQGERSSPTLLPQASPQASQPFTPDFVIKQLKEHLVIQQQESQQLREQNHTLQEKNHTLQEQNHTLQEQTHTLQEKNHTLQEQNHTLQEKNHTLQEQDRTLQEKNHALQEQDRTLQEKNHALQEQDRTLQEQTHTLQKQNHTLQVQVTAAEQEILSFKHDLNVEKEKVGELKSVSGKLESSIAHLQEQLESEVGSHNATRLLLRTEHEQSAQREAIIQQEVTDLKKQCFSATLLSVKMNMVAQNKHLVGFPSVHDLFDQAIELNIPFQEYGKFICEKMVPTKPTDG
ncbi:slit-robo rho GTPase activating protein 1,3 [Pelomyxa schiedti]|nr:slit-robo rho GTPase activating protein 1,3 [Pelomyxa schiedti]